MQPIEIPAGVVSTPTKKMRSSNYSEVNMFRWKEGSMLPIGGQARIDYGFVFASPCRKIHTWADNNAIAHVAYLCDQHVYVDTGGELIDITPVGGMPPPFTGSALGGYGDGDYGVETYGTPRSDPGLDRSKRMPSVFSMDNWGEQLLVMTSQDSRLLFWDPNFPTSKLAVVPDSPQGRCFVVTPERFVMMFGIGLDFRTFGWCDQENYSDWNFASSTNKAGQYQVEPAAPFITAISTENGVLFWTAKKPYIAKFVGLPYIYSYDELGEGTSPWSPQSVTKGATAVMWMSDSGMWQFDGSTIQPVGCSVRDWINDNYDATMVRIKSTAVNMTSMNEFWWFFPTDGVTENNRVAIYNYKEGWWSQGRLNRTAGADASYNQFPIMTSSLYSYYHERGDAYAEADLPWVETFNLNIASGDKLMMVRQMMPDVEGDVSQLGFSLRYTMERSQKIPEKISATVTVRPDGYVDFRKTGRDFRLRIDMLGPLVPKITLGQHLFDAVPRGSR